MARLTERDHYTEDPLDRIQALEVRIAELERVVATALQVLDAGTSGATEAGWIQVDGGYLHVFASK